MVSNEIWMDSGAMVSMIPEQDIYLGKFEGTETDNGSTLTILIGSDFTDEFSLVPNLYRGCELELYLDADNTFQDKTIITSNTATTITFNDSIIAGLKTQSEDYYGIIKALGAPVPAPKASGNAKLLSDTWIGLTDSVTIPSTAIEMKQIALSSGSRNMAYQFKGAETTSGGSFSLSANNFSWLYYALGDMDIATVTNATAVTLPSADADKSNNTVTNIAGAGASGNNFIYDDDSTAPGGKRFYRVVGTTICPPIQRIVDDYTAADLKAVNHTLTNKITYTFSESNTHTLPSFALEYTLKKPASMSTVATDITSTSLAGTTTEADGSGPPSSVSTTRNISETVYSKIYPGCQVESLNITADAGQEVKMSVNFNSKNTFTAPNAYDTANGKTDLQDWVNFGSPKGGQGNISEEQLRPFFFSDGTIEMFGQEYIRIENMTLDISNSLQPKRFIGRYDKNSQTHIPGQRTYSLSFTGLVTDNLLFEELRNNAATSLGGTDGNQIKINFVKDTTTNAETLAMTFKDYMVTNADFPLTNDKGPITVNWTIQPLELHECIHATNWIIQG